MSASPATLVEALVRRSGDTPDGVAFRTLVAGGASTEDVWTWGRWAEVSRLAALALKGAGLEPGDRVAVLAGNVPLWPVGDLAVQWAGMTSVGLYPTSAPVQVAEVLADSGARAVLVDSAAQLAKVTQVLHHLPGVELVVRPDDVPTPGAPAGARHLAWSELLALAPTGARELPPPEPAADAVLIYTSGSTGAPKGARLAHETLVASARSIRETLGLEAGERTLSFLPYCHAAERIFGLATRLVVGMEAGLVPDATRVFEAAAAFQPTLFGGLPRFYEKVYEAELADRAAGGRPAAPAVQRLLGGRVRVATSGGAVLPREVAETLQGLGLTVLGAYGLTEHLCATFNRPEDSDFDTAGPPMPGTEIRIAGDGEILIRRSVLTFRGYLGRPDETTAAFTPDGAWLRTGDLGRLDEAGRLRITGRKKELLALSTGKKVAPLPIEAWLAEQPWIEQAVLLGEGRKFVAALLTLRRRVVEAWARKEGMEAPWPDLLRDHRVWSHVDTQVAAVNERLSRTESVRRFLVLEEPLSVEAGTLTPTLKVRRDMVASRFAHQIEDLYARVST